MYLFVYHKYVDYSFQFYDTLVDYTTPQFVKAAILSHKSEHIFQLYIGMLRMHETSTFLVECIKIDWNSANGNRIYHSNQHFVVARIV